MINYNIFDNNKKTRGFLSVDDVLPLMGKVTKSNGWYRGQCPICDDMHHSKRKLYAKQIDNHLVLKCFHGCSYRDIIAKFKELGAVHRD